MNLVREFLKRKFQHLSNMNSSDFLRMLGIDDQTEVLEVPRAKKRRLDHLTWDEKIQRK